MGGNAGGGGLSATEKEVDRIHAGDAVFGGGRSRVEGDDGLREVVAKALQWFEFPLKHAGAAERFRNLDLRPSPRIVEAGANETLTFGDRWDGLAGDVVRIDLDGVSFAERAGEGTVAWTAENRDALVPGDELAAWDAFVTVGVRF